MRLWFVLAGLTLGSCLGASDDWSFARQQVSYRLQGMTYQELANAGVTYVTHVKPTPENVEEAHRWGVRIMPYVTLYILWDSSVWPGILSDAFMREVDAAQHPDWIVIDESGQRRPPYWVVKQGDTERPPTYRTCFNRPGVLEAYIQGVENVLALGGDGVFVDLVNPYRLPPPYKCYGPEFGIHQHVYPDKNHAEMFLLALAEVYRTVKAHGPEFAVMLNSGGEPVADAIDSGDTLMMEGFVFRRYAAGLGQGDVSVLCRSLGWGEVLDRYEEWRDFTDQGGSVAPLCCLTTRELEKPHAFLTYVSAKLAGFQQWAPENPRERQDIVRQLYRADVGMPVGPLQSQGSLYFRRYERALIVGNWGTGQVRAELPWHLGDPRVADLYSGELMLARDGTLRVELPPDSGRVYVTQDAYLANCLGEVAGMAQSCSLRLADMADEGGFCTDTASAARRIVDDVVVRARNCWDAVRQGGVPTDLATQREITDLVRALDSVETTAGVASAEERLLSGDGLSAEDLPALSMANEDLPFEVVVTEEAVTLKSGHACYSFATAGTAAHFVFEQNGVHTNMGVWVTPSGLEGEHGWLRARRIEDIRIVQEDPETKSVEFAVKLYGSESLEDVTGLDVSVRATIERGVAGVQLASALRNHTDRLLPGVVWFWAINVPWYTLPDGRTERPRAGVTPQDYDWVYLHRYDNRYERGIRGYGTGGGGVVVADFPHIAYDESEAQVLADPISQDLQSGGEMPIGWTAYPQTDRFLWQRLRWYRQYASLAAQTVTGTRLGLETPASVVAGVPADITVRLAGGDTEEMEGIELRLSGSSGVRHLEVVAAGEPNDRSSEFSVSIPGDLEQGARVDLCATASADGAQMPLHLAAYATLFVRPPVEVVDLRQAPAADGGLGFVARLRNNLTQELPVALTLSGEALPAAYSQTAVLAAEGVSSVRLAPPGALVPADVDEVSAELSISYDVRGYEDSLDYAVKVPLVPQAVCRITEDAPTLDGLLDDTCWETATKLVGFADPRTRQLAGEPTVCYVAADDMNLYVALDCQEMDVDHLRTDAQPNRWGRNPDVPWGDDCVQIDVDPRVIGQGLFRLALNSAGTAKSTAPGGWEAAIAIGDGRWVVEMKIPSEILGARPQAGAVWGFNANRNDSGSGRSAWSRTHGWWSSLQQFGGLLFTE